MGQSYPSYIKDTAGNSMLLTLGGDPTKLNETQKETIDAVLAAYGNKTSGWLSQLTHRESPWRDARNRARLDLGERGHSQIRLDDMTEYYGGLSAEQAA